MYEEVGSLAEQTEGTEVSDVEACKIGERTVIETGVQILNAENPGGMQNIHPGPLFVLLIYFHFIHPSVDPTPYLHSIALATP